MLWTRALRTLFRHPLYLVITLLPVLLTGLLIFPLVDLVFSLILQIGSMAYLDMNPFYSGLPFGHDFATPFVSSLFPVIGITLVLLTVNLLSSLLLTPIALQCLGDATRLDRVPPGFAGRGLRRLWWKPFVYGLMYSLVMGTVSSLLTVPMALFGALTALSRLQGLYAAISVVSALALSAVTLFAGMVTAMFYAGIAMEDCPFGEAILRALKRAWRSFGPLLGVFASAGAILAAAIAAVFILYVVILSCSMASFAIEAESFTAVGALLNRLQTDICIIALIISVLAWFTGSFATAYAFQRTHHIIRTQTPAGGAPAGAAPAAALPAEEAPTEEAPAEEAPAEEAPAEEAPAEEAPAEETPAEETPAGDQ